MRLILASGSPRRRQLLADAGVAFSLAEPYRVEETWPAEMPVERVAEYLAAVKSDAFERELAPDEVLLTADTTVILPAETPSIAGLGGVGVANALDNLVPSGAGGEILGKPAGRREGIDMLGRLSGREHRVITGVVLRGAHSNSSSSEQSSEAGCAARRERRESFSVTTRVWFRELTKSEIEYYVDTFSPFDKAGAYGIQEWIGLVGVERIDGSFYNVMGLPVQAIVNRLKNYDPAEPRSEIRNTNFRRTESNRACSNCRGEDENQ